MAKLNDLKVGDIVKINNKYDTHINGVSQVKSDGDGYLYVNGGNGSRVYLTEHMDYNRDLYDITKLNETKKRASW